MSKTIWKFPLKLTDGQVLMIPEGAEILTVQLQNQQPYLWAVVNPEHETELRKFEIHGTGNPIAAFAERRYVATFQQPPFVWHVFERL